MKSRSKLQKHHFFLVVLLVFSFLVRIAKPNLFPLTHDELGYVYNSYSIAQTGRDVNGLKFPLNFDTGDPKSPVPVYIGAFFHLFFSPSHFTARLPFALSGIISIFLVYLLAKNLRLNHSTALLSAFFFSLSPWHTQISRIAYDANFALMFTLLTCVLLTKKTGTTNTSFALLMNLPGIAWLKAKSSRGERTKSTKLVIKKPHTTFLLSLLSTTLAFFSYHGAKVWLLFIIPSLFLYQNSHPKSWKLHRLISFASLFIIPSVLFLIVSQTGNAAQRFSDTSIFDPQKATIAVDTQRRTSTAPQTLRKLIHNKPTYYLNTFTHNYLEVLSSCFLFSEGEQNAIYSVWHRGQLLLVAFPLILLGILPLFYTISYSNPTSKLRLRLVWPKPEVEKSSAFLILSFLLLGPITVGITSSGGSSVRAFFTLVPLSILTALGFQQLISTISQNHKHTKLFATISYLLLAISFFLYATYLYQYFFRYPIYASRELLVHEQQLVTLSHSFSGTDTQIVIGTTEPGILWQFAYLLPIHPTDFFDLWQQHRSGSPCLSLNFDDSPPDLLAEEYSPGSPGWKHGPPGVDSTNQVLPPGCRRGKGRKNQNCDNHNIPNLTFCTNPKDFLSLLPSENSTNPNRILITNFDKVFDDADFIIRNPNDWGTQWKITSPNSATTTLLQQSCDFCIQTP